MPAPPAEPDGGGQPATPAGLIGAVCRLLPGGLWRRRTQSPSTADATAPPASLGLVYLLTLADPGRDRGLALDGLRDVLRDVDSDLAIQPDCGYQVRLVHGSDDRLRGDRQPAGLLTRRALRRPFEVTRFDEVLTSVHAALRRDLAEIGTTAARIGVPVARPAVVLVTTDPPIADRRSVVAFRELAAEATVIWLVPRKTEDLVNPVFGDRAPAVVIAESESAAGRICETARGLRPATGRPLGAPAMSTHRPAR
jgi:hypothetical protein